MKRIFLIIYLISFISVFAQSPVDKMSNELKSKLENETLSSRILVWIYFTDKGSDIQKYFSNPRLLVSEKSLSRRSKNPIKTKIDFSDIPANQNYINVLVQNGFEVKQKSKWFNAVSGYASRSKINQTALNPFVKKIDVVGTFANRKDDIEFTSTENSVNKILQPEGIHSLNYGNSFTQLNQISVPQVHDLGYDGSGITICLMDAGFDNLIHEVFQSMNILATWDFVNGDSIVANQADMGEGSHGTATLSIIGGFKEGQLIGPAYAANYLLAKTENTDSETPVEEDNWIATLEWADSIGVDVTSTSLGYLTYDDPFTSYTWENMDGNTALITIAADLAVAKGIIVVNSAGNEGLQTFPNTLSVPADGDSVITVGSVDDNGNRAYYSSYGPTVDGRIKPDVMAMGMRTYIATATSSSSYTISFPGGTSFSCPLVAGVCALILQKNPNLTPMEVLDLLRSTASNSSIPNNLMGWGIVNALAAIDKITDVKAETGVPESFYLLTNYPNPFNPSTKIRYVIPENGFVKIILHDMLGREVKTLLSENMNAGSHEINLDASSLSSGTYFVQMIAGQVQKIIKISLVK